MTQINTFNFEKDKIKLIKNNRFGEDWPAVYFIENGKEAYIGESHNVYNRSLQHIKKQDKVKLHKIHIIGDEKYNKSATLDTESLLIQYVSADGKFKLQNSNKGLLNHNYFDRERYVAKFEDLWIELKKMRLVSNDLIQLKNSDLFKYSPYKALTTDQLIVAKKIVRNIKEDNHDLHIINGRPGTGKTILAIYLFKLLSDLEETQELKIGLIVPMNSLRKTLKKVFTKIKGLKANMVIGPSGVINSNYDILIVDEAHRLRRRKNLGNYYGTFDSNNKKMGLNREADEFDWILKNSKTQILFFDENQTIKPSDVLVSKIKSVNAKKYDLKSQLRVNAGQSYIDFIDDTFDLYNEDNYVFEDYEFNILDNINSLVDLIKKKDKEHGLSRMVAGYAWEWKTKNGGQFDIEIDGLKLIWNSKKDDWVNSKNAVNEVGCIHTVQGYDLNYTGVIIGPEIYFDKDENMIKIDKDKYMDINGKTSIDNPEELRRYIINIYKTLMTRGIKGTFVYIVDKNLRQYFLDRIGQVSYIQNAEVKLTQRIKIK